MVSRQVPTLKQASPLRVSPERRLVLDCRRYEIACVCWLMRTRFSTRLGPRPRRPAFRLPTTLTMLHTSPSILGLSNRAANSRSLVVS